MLIFWHLDSICRLVMQNAFMLFRLTSCGISNECFQFWVSKILSILHMLPNIYISYIGLEDFENCYSMFVFAAIKSIVWQSAALVLYVLLLLGHNLFSQLHCTWLWRSMSLLRSLLSGRNMGNLLDSVM